jgi:hypothetical protein
MPTPRQYQFDVDTKRYLNRVNTYRALSGLPDIQKSDAADIDNFVIGLKDLGIWNQSICFLLRSQHNVGAGSRVFSIGGQDNVIGNAVGSPTWSLSGITFSGTNYITALLNKTIQTSEVSIASVANSTTMTPGFPYQLSISTNIFNTYGFGIVSFGSFGNSWQIETYANVGSRIAPSAITNQTSRLNGGRLFSGGIQNYLNGSTTTDTGARNNQIFDRIQICGRWNNGVVECSTGSVGWIGTQSLVMVSLDYIDFASLQSLVKQTIGKGLGLP